MSTRELLYDNRSPGQAGVRPSAGDANGRLDRRSGLDLDEFFYELRNHRYAIVKPFELDSYHCGADIDVFCQDVVEVAQTILRIGNQYAMSGYEIEVAEASFGRQAKIDFYRGGVLEFRFDLYGRLPPYQKVHLRPAYFSQVLEDRQTHWRVRGPDEYPVFYPSELDQLVLCYVEFFETYHLRPDKIKHLDYVCNRTSSDENLLDFLKRLHWYTALPDVEPTIDLNAPHPSTHNRRRETLRNRVRHTLGRIVRVIRAPWKLARLFKRPAAWLKATANSWRNDRNAS